MGAYLMVQGQGGIVSHAITQPPAPTPPTPLFVNVTNAQIGF